MLYISTQFITLKEDKIGKHLHKLLSLKEEKEVFEKYLSKKIGEKQALELLNIRKRQFFKLVNTYKKNPSSFYLDNKEMISSNKVVPQRSPSKDDCTCSRFVVSVLCIIAAGFWAYHNSFSGAFILDDDMRILRNFHIRHLWPIWDVFRGTSRPLVELSLAINYALGGTHVIGYHIVNFFIHLCAALVLFGVVRRTFQTEFLRTRYEDASNGLALSIALLWIVHPLQTESVTYIIQRAESLMGLCYLTTLYCVIRGITSEKQRGWYMAAVIACTAGMASKPIMVTAPLLVLLYDRTFISGTFRQALNQRKGLYLGLTVTWGLFAVLLATVPADPGAGLGIKTSPLAYAKTQPGVLLHYLKLSIWPKSLCLYYGWPAVSTLKEIVGPLLVIGPLIFLTLWALRTHQYIGFLGAWFFLILAPSSSFIPIQDYVFEHRMYLSLAAIIGLVVLGGYELLGLLLVSRQHLRRITAIACVAISMVFLGLTTIHRNEDYRSEESIWRDTISKSSNSALVRANMGVALNKQGHLEEAKIQFIEILQQDPNNANAHYNLGNVLDEQGDFEEAKVHYLQALKLKPSFAEAYGNLGFVLDKQGHSEEAKDYYLQALQLNPNSAKTHNALGYILDKEDHLEEAKAHYLQALQLNSDLAEAYNGLGYILVKQDNLEAAKDQFLRALRLNPDYAKAHNGLGIALNKQGHLEEAKAHYLQALQLDPKLADVQNNLGVLLAQQGHLEAAKDQFLHVLQLDPGLAGAHNILGTVLEMQGHRQEAIAQFREALRLKPDDTLAKKNLDRIMKTSQTKP